VATSKQLATVAAYLAALSLSACGTAPEAVSSQSPVTPSTADVSAAVSFDHFKNSLGDPLEAINLRITTNIPVAVRVQVHLDPPSTTFAIHDGDNFKKCIGDGCLVTGAKALADWWCSNDCPRGLYKVTLDVCSYAENQGGLSGLGIRCNHQQKEFLDWVGKLGVNLMGNALAVKDPDHSAIVNLRRQLTVGRTSEGKVASNAEVAAAQRHVEALKAVDKDLASVVSRVPAACNGNEFSAACQQALQETGPAFEQAQATVRAASLPCSASDDAKYVDALESVRAANVRLLTASRNRNSFDYNAGVAEVRILSSSLSSSYSAAVKAPCP
jgi:hypothetical protein